ncbi:hypothetical protein Tco_0734674 [Tanacetum coccineum]
MKSRDFSKNLMRRFYEAWDRFNDLLRGCPHHGFSELHQLDTFYNALNSNDQDSLNSAAGGNFLDKMPRECLKIIESKSKPLRPNSTTLILVDRPPIVPNQIDLLEFPPVQKFPHANSQNNFNRGNNFNQNRGNNFNQGWRNMQNQGQNLQSQMANLTDMLSKFVTANTASTSGSGTLPGNTITNPKEEFKRITTETRNPNPEPNVAPVVTPVPKASIPFPSRRNMKGGRKKLTINIGNL